ncbi:MAG: hypothetical protein C0592_09440 [Marinilabiliales bacterium]|nr:MAG: hypothetical protein C0592_09440 [Marinilabiliales bacterium]
MQKFILACALIFSGTCISAQTGTTKADPRVSDHFGQEKIELWQNSNDSIEYYNFIASHVFELYSQEYIDAVNPANIKTINLSDSEIEALQTDISQFNIFSSTIPWKTSENQWYKVVGTNLYLLIHNEEYINKKFNSVK